MTSDPPPSASSSSSETQQDLQDSIATLATTLSSVTQSLVKQGLSFLDTIDSQPPGVITNTRDVLVQQAIDHHDDGFLWQEIAHWLGITEEQLAAPRPVSISAEQLKPSQEGSTALFRVDDPSLHGALVDLWNSIGYVARNDDTLEGIATANGLTVLQLLALNPTALRKVAGSGVFEESAVADTALVETGDLYIVEHPDLDDLMTLTYGSTAPAPAPRPADSDSGVSADGEEALSVVFLPFIANGGAPVGAPEAFIRFNDYRQTQSALSQPQQAVLTAADIALLETFPESGPLTVEQSRVLAASGLTHDQVLALKNIPPTGPLTKAQSDAIQHLQTGQMAAGSQEMEGFEAVTDPDEIARLNIGAGFTADDVYGSIRWFQKNGRYFTLGYDVYDQMIKPVLSGAYGPWGSASDTAPAFTELFNGEIEGWPGLLHLGELLPESPGASFTTEFYTYGDLPLSSRMLYEGGLGILRVRNPIARYVSLEDVRIAHTATRAFMQDRAETHLDIINAIYRRDTVSIVSAIDRLDSLQERFLDTVAPTFKDIHEATFDLQNGLFGNERVNRNPFLPDTNLGHGGSTSIFATGIRATANTILGINPQFKSALGVNPADGDPYRATTHWERFKATWDSKSTVTNGYTQESYDSAIQTLRNLAIDGFNTARNASMIASVLAADSPEAMGQAFANFGYTVTGYTIGEAMEKLTGYGTNAAMRGPLMDLINGNAGPGTAVTARALRSLLTTFGIEASDPQAFATFLQATRGTAEIAGWETGGAIGWTLFDITGAEASYKAGYAFYEQLSEQFADGSAGWNLLAADSTTQQMAYGTVLASVQRYVLFAGAVEKFALVSDMAPSSILESVSRRSSNGALHALRNDSSEARAFLGSLQDDTVYRQLVLNADQAIRSGDGQAVSRTTMAIQDYLEYRAPLWIETFGSEALQQTARTLAPDAASGTAAAYRAFAEAAGSATDDIAQEATGKGFKLGARAGVLGGLAVDGLFIGADAMRMLDAETPEAFGAAFRSLVQQTLATSGGLAAAGLVTTVYGLTVAGTGGSAAAASPVAVGVVSGATELGTSLTLDYVLSNIDNFDAIESWATRFKATYFPDTTLAQVMFEHDGPIRSSQAFIHNSWAGVPDNTKAGLFASADARREAFTDAGNATGAFLGDVRGFTDQAIEDETRARLQEARSGLSGWFWHEWDQTVDIAGQVWNGATGLWSGATGLYEAYVAAPTRQAADQIFERMPPEQKLAVYGVQLLASMGKTYVEGQVETGRQAAENSVTSWLGSFIETDPTTSGTKGPRPASGPMGPKPASEETWASGPLAAGVRSLDWLNDMGTFVGEKAAEGVTNTHLAVEMYLADHPEAREELATLIDASANGLAWSALAFVENEKANEVASQDFFNWLSGNPDGSDPR